MIKQMRFFGRSARPLWSLIAVAGLVGTLKNEASAQTTITTVNNEHFSGQPAELTVYPGDAIQLVADDVETSETGAASNKSLSPKKFRWTSNTPTPDGKADACSPESDCTGTNFEANEYGVTFYVPTNMTGKITLEAQNRDDAGDYDQITLVNGNAAAAAPSTPDAEAPPAYGPPASAVSDPEDYPANASFDYERGLAGQGNWVVIAGVRYFKPIQYIEGWQPYTHGYWYWTAYGWTWHSFDPHGYITHHYGIWRNHGVYGWIWTPIPGYNWRPAVVTWYYTNAGVGWYPYFDGYAAGYMHGQAHGFRDGYWLGAGLGYQPGVAIGWSWGYSYVPYTGFLSANIHEFCAGAAYRTWSAGLPFHEHFGLAYGAGHYGLYLSETGYAGPREFIERHANVAVTETAVHLIERRTPTGERIQWVAPVARATVPASYGNVLAAASARVASRAVVPIGTLVYADGRTTRPAAPMILAPSPRPAAIQAPAPVAPPLAAQSPRPQEAGHPGFVAPQQHINASGSATEGAITHTQAPKAPEFNRGYLQVPQQRVPAIQHQTPGTGFLPGNNGGGRMPVRRR